MHHYVFCAATNPDVNKKSIKIAKGVVKHLENQWSLQEDVVLYNYHSKISIIEHYNNIEIKFENRNTIQLIDDCMEFARLKERFDRIYSTLSDSDIE